MQELIKAAAIENQLTGTVKLANEERDPALRRRRRRQSDVEPAGGQPAAPKPAAAATGATARQDRRRRSASRADAVREFEKINRPDEVGSGHLEPRPHRASTAPLHRTESHRVAADRRVTILSGWPWSRSDEAV